MSRYVFKLPDLGEGTVQAEIVGWRVKPGDTVAEDDVIVEVMTDKAAVELPSPVAGRVVSTTGEAGDRIPVGGELIVFETAGGTAAKPTASKPAAMPKQAAPAARSTPAIALAQTSAPDDGAPPEIAERVATSPAIRRRAHDAGVDLTRIVGSGPNGRIVRADFEAYMAGRSRPEWARARPSGKSTPAAVEEIKVIGVRRLIAQRMADSKRNIPHFAYIEELDVTELEALRKHLSTWLGAPQPALTYLPFLVKALVRVLAEFPQCNAHYDAERGVIVRHSAVHVGVATQTAEGLKVPVVRDAQERTLWQLASEIRRVTDAARDNRASREELMGSTITVTSLGKLGGIASTPIINAPEVAILGVNRAVERPVVRDGSITIRRMMNLSSSFDHRFVDGYDAAAMVQALKDLLEHPATLFIDQPDVDAAAAE